MSWNHSIETRTMTAKFDGTCTRCKGRIITGQAILWTRGAGAQHAMQTSCDVAIAARQVAQAVPQQVVDSAAIVAFLKAARERGLKAPAVRFLDAEQHELRLSLAKETGKNPGAVYVKRYGAYIGKVAADGTADQTLGDALINTLRTIAADPAAAAKAYAALTGRCSFCSLQLTDAGSVAVGYGPVCAKHYGLPHTALGTPAAVDISAAA